MKRKSRKPAVLALAALCVFFAITCLFMNMSVSIHQGIDGRYRHVTMPLYAKWTQFLARHYEYARLSGEITAGCRTGEDKVLAILRWTRDAIKDIPADMPLVDDHIVNIIIRGYGAPDQFQDVFTTLCSYAGIPAFWERISDKTGRVRYALSFVRLEGTWRVFDAYRGAYYRTGSGEIAGVDDMTKEGASLRRVGAFPETVLGVPYEDFYRNAGSAGRPATLRAEKQKPYERIVFETKKALGLEREQGEE